MQGLARVVVISMFLAFVPAVHSETRRDHDIGIEDYFSQADIVEISMSPDGRYVAYSEARWQQSTDDRKTDLWVVETGGGKPKRLTAERGGDRMIRWSGDSRWIYFLGSRSGPGEKRPPYAGKAQVWRISPAQGQASAVTRVPEGIAAYELARDEGCLYYAIEKEEIAEEWKKLWQTYRQLSYGHGLAKRSEIWRLDLSTWRAAKAADDHRYVYEMALSPDGRKLAIITAPDEKVVSFEGRSRIDVCDLATKTIRTVPDRLFRAGAPSPYGWLERLAWSADSKLLAFTVIFDGYPAEMLVADCSSDPAGVTRLKRPSGLSLRGYGSPIQWRGRTSQLCFLGEQEARVRLCAAKTGEDAENQVETWTPGDVVVSMLSFDAAGERCAVVMNGPKSFNDVYTIEKGSEPKAITHVNPQADTWRLPQLSIVSWRGARGDGVQGILELPPEYQAGQKLPLVVEIHGGPTTALCFGLQFWIYGRTLLPAKGYALFVPNYRGSTGYGDKFLIDLIGHENDVEVEDILKGVDALVERRIADPDRLGVSGWSNGGYLTDCIISKTTRFKAASSGAGIVDTVMEWGANDEPAYPTVFKQGFPWNKAENYHRASPTYSLDKIRTPTLIHVGGNDERCPPGHSRMLFRALHEYVHVPTELVVYPNEPHGLTTYKHRQAKMEWDLAWFDRYLRNHSSK
jgi:dipeptidyl aminopeptidase/acylaminoacyl peptidase